MTTQTIGGITIPDTALVVVGFGRGWEASLARDRDPRYEGRHFTLPAVHPDVLPAWVASADVALCTLPPLSFNQRHATPNKFFEAIAAGTPIVLGPDLPLMESIVRADDLGTVAGIEPRRLQIFQVVAEAVCAGIGQRG